MSAIRVDLALPIGAHSVRVSFESDARDLAIVGPSGCGKSTLLRAIAGFEPRARGLVEVRGARWQDGARSLVTPEERGIGWAPQEALLFPHLSVRENALFGAKEPRELGRVAAALGIGELLARAPRMLSGGERQRVALARALLRSPSTLLLDEPLSALDRSARVEVARAVAAEREALGALSLVVSHDEGDVSTLATEVAAITW